MAPEAWLEDVGTVTAAAGSERATPIAHGHAAQMALLFAASIGEGRVNGREAAGTPVEARRADRTVCTVLR